MADASVAEKSAFPVGEARKLAEVTAKNWREHLVLLSQVDNEVLEVNPHVYIPLKLEKGKRSPLGLFAQAMMENPVLPHKGQVGEFWRGHHRSVILGRAIFGDKDGNIWRDIDLKGAGFISTMGPYEPKVYKVGDRGHGEYFGLQDRDIAFTDYTTSEEMLAEGIRTNRTLAIIGLKELIIDGQKIAVEALKKKGKIAEDFYPVVQVRAFGTKFRVQDYSSLKEDRNLTLEDAKKLVCQELGREDMSAKEFGEWFVQTLGKNVGLMHQNGWTHGYLTRHNITLDCRIVDLDSIEPLTEEARIDDLKSVEQTLHNAYFLTFEIGDVVEEFQKSYAAVFTPRAGTIAA